MRGPPQSSPEDSLPLPLFLLLPPLARRLLVCVQRINPHSASSIPPSVPCELWSAQPHSTPSAPLHTSIWHHHPSSQPGYQLTREPRARHTPLHPPHSHARLRRNSTPGAVHVPKGGREGLCASYDGGSSNIYASVHGVWTRAAGTVILHHAEPIRMEHSTQIATAGDRILSCEAPFSRQWVWFGRRTSHSGLSGLLVLRLSPGGRPS